MFDRAFKLLVVALAALLWGAAMAQPRDRVDVALVLAADVSTSIDAERFDLQRQGYAAAFRHPRVVEAMLSGVHHRIAVTMVEWAGQAQQRVVVPWTVIDGPDSAERFAVAILAAPRPFDGWTAIGAGMQFAMTVFATAPPADRQVIDVSGDGINNDGASPSDVRDAAVAAGITVNGLVIMADAQSGPIPQAPLDDYYRDNVIGGPGAFLIVVDDFDSFAHGVRNKLVREVAGR